MADHDDPDTITGDDTLPIDDTLRAAIDAAERHLDATSGADPIVEARNARDRRVRHRRVRIRAITLGAAAVVLLAVIGTVVTVRSGGNQLHTASGPPDASSTARVTRVTANPTGGLSDGDTVTVDADGFQDTTPPPITVYQCAQGNLVDGYVCATANKAPFAIPIAVDANGAPPPPGRETSITVRARLTGLVHIRRAEEGRAAVITPIDQRSIECASQADTNGSAGPTTTGPEVTATDTVEPCVVLVVGNWAGGTLMNSAPIWFGPASTRTDTAPPTTQRLETPGSAVCPGTVPQAPDVSGVDRTSELLDFSPTKAVICTYFLPPEDPAGPPRAVRTIDDTATLTTIRSDLNALGEIPDQVGCTADAGPTVAIIATAGSRTATIWAQDYGCGFTFNGNRMRVGAKSLTWLRD